MTDGHGGGNIVFAVAVLLTSLAAAQPTSNLATYPIDWKAVPLASTENKNLTSNCICDVTENACDPSCCCDSLCPSGLVNETIREGRCLPEGPPDQTLDFCVPDSSVEKVSHANLNCGMPIAVRCANAASI